MEYREIIDKLLNRMEQELTSAHELTTKAINYEYNMGQLYGLYSIAESLLSPEDFVELYDYRRADRDRISMESNWNVQKVYGIVRKANGRNSR